MWQAIAAARGHRALTVWPIVAHTEGMAPTGRKAMPKQKRMHPAEAHILRCAQHRVDSLPEEGWSFVEACTDDGYKTARWEFSHVSGMLLTCHSGEWGWRYYVSVPVEGN